MNDVPFKINALVKDYGSLRAVNKVSFELKSGEVFGLLGPNGAGKTTLISIVTTLESPISGMASVFGLDVTSSNQDFKRLIGVVP